MFVCVFVRFPISIKLNVTDLLTGQGHEGVVLCLEPPLQYTNVCVERKRLLRVFESDTGRRHEEFLVNIRMGLKVKSFVITRHWASIWTKLNFRLQSLYTM